MKSALICGISGQDGGYLAAHLLGLGYRVVGTSRDAHASGFESLKKLGIYDRITIESMTLIDFRSVVEVLDRVRPDEIYNLAGQSSIAVSFAQPLETFQGIVMGRFICSKRCVSSDFRVGCSMRAVLKYLDRLGMFPSMNDRSSNLETPTRLPRQAPCGRSRITETSTGYGRLPGFSSIMKVRFGRHDL